MNNCNQNNEPVQAILGKLNAVKPSGNNKWSARCPAHEDRHASLSVGLGEDGRALLKCHAGCSLRDILHAMGLTEADLFPPKCNPYPANPQRPRKPTPTPKNEPIRQRHEPATVPKTSGNIVAEYSYRDENGALLFQVVRYDPKGFRHRRPAGKGGWIWKLDDTPRVLYRLPELIQADPSEWVFLVEGEKDVDNLFDLGLTATTCPGGAGKWDKLADDSALQGRKVAILPDNDTTGWNHARNVAQRLQGKAAVVKIVELDGLPSKGDVSDWIGAEGTMGGKTAEIKERLIDLAENAPEWTPEAAEQDHASGPVLVNMADVEPQAVEWLWQGRIPLGRLTLLVGRPGEGKSFLTTDLAGHITTGKDWPDGLPCPLGSVLLVSVEDDPADTIRPRLDAAGADVNKVSLLAMVRRIDKESGESSEVLFTLADVGNLEEALKKLPDCKLIVIDPIGSFIGGSVDSYKDNEVRGVLAPVAMLAGKYGPAVLVVAHTRKAGGKHADDLAMGSRAFTGIARASWHLTRDEQDKGRRLLLPGKNNLASQADGLAFRIEGEPARLVWESEPIPMHADDVLALENERGEPRKPGPDPIARNNAAEWLRELLSSGPMEVGDVRNEAQAAGYSWRTVERAKDSLSIKSERRAFGEKWRWVLPDDSAGPRYSPSPPRLK